MKHTTPIYILGLGLPAAKADGGLYPAALAHPVLASAAVLVGGKAQLADFAAHPAEKLVVGADTAALYAAIGDNRAAGKIQVVLCSGDPLFFGLGARLVERFGAGGIRVLPGVSSLQAAAAFLGMAWEGFRPVSLHGRADWLPLAHALPCNTPIFLLTDAVSTPQTVAAYLHERGWPGYRLHVLGNLYTAPDGAVQAESYACLSSREALKWQPAEVSAEQTARNGAESAAPANRQRTSVQRVIVLEPVTPVVNAVSRTSTSAPATEPQSASVEGLAFGLPDAAFTREKNLVTKAPVRAAGLAALGIHPDHVVWDLGAGSGSVGIEASRLAHKGLVVAVERNAERIIMIHENRQRFGAAHLEIVHAALPDCLLPENKAAYGSYFPLPRPHRIFMGGGLGGTEETARKTLVQAWEHLLPGGRIVIHCVLLASLERARALLTELGGTVSVTCVQASRSTPLAGDLRLEAMNPVFLVVGEKGKDCS